MLFPRDITLLQRFHSILAQATDASTAIQQSTQLNILYSDMWSYSSTSFEIVACLSCALEVLTTRQCSIGDLQFSFNSEINSIIRGCISRLEVNTFLGSNSLAEVSIDGCLFMSCKLDIEC